MKSCIVNIQEILKDPNLNLSAKHWCDKKATPEEELAKFQRLKKELREVNKRC